jgi:hypothetical protein
MTFWKPTKTKKKEPRPPDPGQAVIDPKKDSPFNLPKSNSFFPPKFPPPRLGLEGWIARLTTTHSMSENGETTPQLPVD